MTTTGEVVLGRSDEARRRWRSARAQALLSGVLLAAIWLALWSGLVTSVVRGARPAGAAPTSAAASASPATAA